MKTYEVTVVATSEVKFAINADSAYLAENDALELARNIYIYPHESYDVVKIELANG